MVNLFSFLYNVQWITLNSLILLYYVHIIAEIRVHEEKNIRAGNKFFEHGIDVPPILEIEFIK